MSALTLLLAAYGICFGLMNDKAMWLTDPLKRILFRPDHKTGSTFFERMLVCPYCTGFHAGWMVWLIGVFPTYFLSESLSGHHLGEVILCAFASSVFCYGVDTVIQWFERP
jgi:hypothetical protein